MSAPIQRNIESRAHGALDHFPVLSIQGARRVGKSTLAASLVSDRQHTIVTLDDMEQLSLAREDPRGFLAQGDGAIMVIDEVQRVPDVLLAVKAAVDRKGTSGQFVVTGSSDFTTLPTTPDSLAGRAVTIHLNGLSQGEIAGVREDFVATVLTGLSTEASESGKVWDRSDYVDAIIRGAYPELRILDDPWRTMWADSYIDRLTARDAQDVNERIPPARLRTVLGLIAANQAGELVKARLASEAVITERAVTACLDTLGALYVIEQIRPWTANVTKRQVGRSKAMVVDSGLAAHLNGIDPNWLQQHIGGNALGPLLEGFVMSELTKQRSWSTARWELSHFRDRTGPEVDAVVRVSDGRIILLEVKASQTYRSEHFSTMKQLAGRLGERLVAGIVLNLSDHPYRFGEKLWGLPVSALWNHQSLM